MPTINELRESRDGATRGISGTRASRRFSVITDTANEDPITVLETNTGGVVPGEPYAWLDFFAFAQDATMEKKHTSKHYTVRVDYGAPIAFSPIVTALPNWRVRFRTVSFPEHIFKEPPDIRGGGERKIIGPNFYAQNEDGVHFANINDNAVQLKQFGGRIPVGFDIELPIVAILIDREGGSFSWAAGINLSLYAKKVNRTMWEGIPARFAYLDDVTIDEEFGTLPSNITGLQQIEGVFYRVSVAMLVRPEQWTPVEMLHTWRDSETGIEVAVQGGGGEPITDWFRKIPEVDFASMFDIIERFGAIRRTSIVPVIRP